MQEFDKQPAETRRSEEARDAAPSARRAELVGLSYEEGRKALQPSAQAGAEPIHDPDSGKLIGHMTTVGNITNIYDLQGELVHIDEPGLQRISVMDFVMIGRALFSVGRALAAGLIVRSSTKHVVGRVPAAVMHMLRTSGLQAGTTAAVQTGKHTTMGNG